MQQHLQATLTVLLQASHKARRLAVGSTRTMCGLVWRTLQSGCSSVVQCICTTGILLRERHASCPHREVLATAVFCNSRHFALMQVAFGVLIPLVLYVIYYRIWVLKELSLLKKVRWHVVC